MRIIDPGHSYLIDVYDSINGPEPRQRIDFVKRMGAKYPGNETAHPGTITQELLRILIHRAKVLDQQENWSGNQSLINDWRLHLYQLEARAAYRHGRVLKRTRLDRDPSGNRIGIESDPTCSVCGHIECEGTCR